MSNIPASIPEPPPDLASVVREQAAHSNRMLEFFMTTIQPLLAFTAAQQSTSASTSAVTPPSFALPRHLKPPPLEPLTGRNRREILPWLNRAKNILNLANLPLNSTISVCYVAAHLKDNALKWFEMVASTVSLDQRAHGGFATFDDFANAMHAALGEQFPADKARDRLFTLKQRASVADYGSEFQRCLAEIPGMDWQTTRHFYLRGLKDNLRMLITGKYPEDATWSDIHLIAMKHDELAFRNSKPGIPNGNRNLSPTPMDLGLVNATKPKSTSRPVSSSTPRKPLTPEERETLLANNGCFYCRKLGHQINDCPAKRAHQAYLAKPKN
jgi:Retrotransposon gag protein/Zinc knuckle